MSKIQQKIEDYIIEHDEELCVEDASAELGLPKSTVRKLFADRGYKKLNDEGSVLLLH